MKPVFKSLFRGITCPAIMLLLLINSNLFSQVTIKERVELDPNDSVKIFSGKTIDIKSLRENLFDAQSGIFISSGSRVTVYFFYSESRYVHDLYLNGELIVPNATAEFELYPLN